MIQNVTKLLKELGIDSYCYKTIKHDKKRDKTYTGYRIEINGWMRVKKYLDEIGFSNENKTKKYEAVLN